jgi:Mn-dependent DtxR family transcriptional regulator
MTEDRTSAGARGSDPETSHLAAERMRETKLESEVHIVLLSHRGRYMTSMDVATEMRIHPWSISPRFRPLWRKGYLKDPIKIPGLNSAGKIRLLQAWTVKDKT